MAVLSELGGDGGGVDRTPGRRGQAGGVPGLEPVVRAGAAVAALGSMLALMLGVSRTTLAMARDRHLPHRWPLSIRAPAASPSRTGRRPGGRAARAVDLRARSASRRSRS